MHRKSVGLNALFPKLGRRGFLERHWPLTPAWHHESPSRLGGLLELDDIGKIVQLSVRSHIRLKAIMRGAQHESNEVSIDAGDIISMYDAGATVVCNDLQRWHAPVAKWARSLTRQLQVAPDGSGCNLYLSPRGVGVGMHFDDHEVVVVQLAGRKRWRFAPNRTVLNPASNSGRILPAEVAVYARGPSPRRMPKGHSVEMSPGSVLFLPRGYWHATDAREMSISLTFGFRNPSWYQLLGNFIASSLVNDADWRAPAWHAWDSSRQRQIAELRWRELRERLPAILMSTSLADLTGDVHGGASGRTDVSGS